MTKKLTTIAITSAAAILLGVTLSSVPVQAADNNEKTVTNAQQLAQQKSFDEVSDEDGQAKLVAHPSEMLAERYSWNYWSPTENLDEVTDENGNDVDFEDVTVIGTVDTNKAGVYPITYQYGKLSVTIEVTMLENTATLIVPDQTVMVGDEWDPFEEVEGVNLWGGELTRDKLYVTGYYDLNTPGVYELEYQSDHRTTTMKLTVLAKDDGNGDDGSTNGGGNEPGDVGDPNDSDGNEEPSDGDDQSDSNETDDQTTTEPGTGNDTDSDQGQTSPDLGGANQNGVNDGDNQSTLTKPTAPSQPTTNNQATANSAPAVAKDDQPVNQKAPLSTEDQAKAAVTLPKTGERRQGYGATILGLAILTLSSLAVLVVKYRRRRN
ncbi:bacterial Ig-like domain-containing protein [Lapidilactobacillus gannanensis]|uniref:Bacterial Ig-like domain-containing protein n=1 Tax=Lapidilactobacillus gannanensis TaxID=2486002 RepID=A0ABW4BJK3_9LACO|nr:bacterial Ig-like domain-containing protein [Lapidilactobacillus gannanensis]